VAMYVASPSARGHHVQKNDVQKEDHPLSRHVFARSNVGS
jgi:hypothetical protein